ncbi:pseudouridine synthase [Clostridium fallax]|uniref:Pseudouridine synthase n=1 Tax=Clostridium fallax TaxID=1533 RepID=A0A1M4XHA4_9CLOT|nr:pseudouridine synthase [Clostridium fallax]SHE92746.1 ribosomal large subunit pseudouridine synthase B [Clostridium fallax]SQB06398.1 ribosomal large subunit pseudouridine synthase B [Clostridium fallax]
MEERLQKYMAKCGVASRRKCEEFILNGDVTVNGVNVTELGVKVKEGEDEVTFRGKIITPEEEKVYIMINKPEGIITSVKDEKNRKTVIDLINVKERIYPIGRLDYDSSGLLLLTNDGDIYNKIIHPRVNIDKVYIALVKGTFSQDEIKQFENGVDIGGYITSKSSIKTLEKYSNSSKVEIKIHEGKNRQIRKMCAALNHEVVSLKRTKIGKIHLKDLPKGKWRNLTKDELDYIKSL